MTVNTNSVCSKSSSRSPQLSLPSLAAKIKTLGDVNADGVVDGSDGVALSRYVAQWDRLQGLYAGECGKQHGRNVGGCIQSVTEQTDSPEYRCRGENTEKPPSD